MRGRGGNRRDAPRPVKWQEPGRAPSAVPALVAGVTGALVPVVAPAVLAWWLGRATRREITSSDGQLRGRGFAVAALVLSGYSLLASAGLAVSAFA